jgi:hypothetical protein
MLAKKRRKEAKNMKKISLMFVFIMIVLILRSVANIASASSRYPGVAPSQFLHYSDVANVSGNDTVLKGYMTVGQGWYNITVLSISGKNVTFQEIDYNNTGIVGNYTNILDVETGSVTGGIYFVVATNLGINDSMYLSPQWESWRINETKMANYLGLQLETNHLRHNESAINDSYNGIVVNATWILNQYWDKSTGILLEGVLNATYSRSDGAGGVLVTYWGEQLLILSTYPVIPEFSPLLTLPLFMIATVLAVIVYRRKHSI